MKHDRTAPRPVRLRGGAALTGTSNYPGSPMASLHPVVIVIEDDPPIRRFLQDRPADPRLRGVRGGNRPAGNDRGRSAQSPIWSSWTWDCPTWTASRSSRRFANGPTLPILILSARSAEQHKIEALDAGADDYLTKPFGLGELLARIRVALRHASSSPGARKRRSFRRASFQVDLTNRWVHLDGEEVHLTPIQYRLLSVLVKHAGKVLTHQQILKEVWGPSYTENSHYLRIYMSQLRQKLEADPTQPKYLLTESGVGYRLKV